MGLLDSVLGAAMGAMGGGQQSSGGGNVALIQAVLGMLGGGQSQGGLGGLGGLIGAMTQGGLGDVAKSWVGTGQNLPISAEQLQSILGNDAIAGLAAKLGMSQGDTAGQLTELLPQIVDKMTPGGSVNSEHAEGFDMGGALDMLKGSLFK